MFNFITDAIENALDVGDSLLSGEDVTKRQIAKLLSDGLSVYAISEATGLAVDAVKKYIKD